MTSSTPEDNPNQVPSSDPTPLETPDAENPDHPHGRDAELSGPRQTDEFDQDAAEREQD